MAELMQLDKAATSVGKSEVTLRRLIKAGKIPYQKERTLTGFVYMVDPDQVRAYYSVREGTLLAEDAIESFRQDSSEPDSDFDSAAQEKVERVRPAAAQSVARVRVAVEGESGSASDYWQKKSEAYEDRYNSEMIKHSQTREELGVWRGRAEQAHSMLMKMLPSPSDVEVRKPENVEQRPVSRKEDTSIVTAVTITVLAVLLAVAVAVVVYLKFIPH